MLIPGSCLKKLSILVFLLLSLSAKAQSPSTPSPSVILKFTNYLNDVRTHTVNEWLIPAYLPIFVGDSRIQNIDFYPRMNAVNFGISGDTTPGMVDRMQRYTSIKAARAVFLAGGVNDLRFGVNFDKEVVTNYGKMFATVPAGRKIFVMGIFPVNEKERFPGYNLRIQAINKDLRQLCAKRPQCVYIDVWSMLASRSGEAREEFMKDDGIHLNESGNGVIIEASLKALRDDR
jgi:lysophospholipase L1-like esterase